MIDNVMSLIAGDHKDEIPWAETWPLVFSITAQGIAQIWLDHAGHNGVRQYGSSTKAWRFDAVGVMTVLDGGTERKPGEVETAFTLSFDPPYGKARRRTPENWRDFAPRTLRLRDDVWSGEDASSIAKRTKGTGLSAVKPGDRAFHAALIDALAVTSQNGSTTEDAWLSECYRKGLLDAADPDDDANAFCRRKRAAGFRTAKSNLITASCIAQDGTRISDLTTSR